MKRIIINIIINKGEADIFLIQETKIKDFHEFHAKSLWANSEVGYSFYNSTGLSGALSHYGISRNWRCRLVLEAKVFWALK